jgi:hypothetical protein
MDVVGLVLFLVFHDTTVLPSERHLYPLHRPVVIHSASIMQPAIAQRNDSIILPCSFDHVNGQRSTEGEIPAFIL